jgi:hypothetical protein
MYILLIGGIMIDLPVGKAILAVKFDLNCERKCLKDDDYRCPKMDCCSGCEINEEYLMGFPNDETCGLLSCIPENRKDGLHVVYKIVDYPL